MLLEDKRLSEIIVSLLCFGVYLSIRIYSSVLVSKILGKNSCENSFDLGLSAIDFSLSDSDSPPLVKF